VRSQDKEKRRKGSEERRPAANSEIGGSAGHVPGGVPSQGPVPDIAIVLPMLVASANCILDSSTSVAIHTTQPALWLCRTRLLHRNDPRQRPRHLQRSSELFSMTGALPSPTSQHPTTTIMNDAPTPTYGEPYGHVSSESAGSTGRSASPTGFPTESFPSALATNPASVPAPTPATPSRKTNYEKSSLQRC
jgi:hypothetical protein